MSSLSPIDIVRAALTHARELEAGATAGRWMIDPDDPMIALRPDDRYPNGWDGIIALQSPSALGAAEGEVADPRQLGDIAQAVTGHNLWSVAFIAPLEAAVEGWERLTDYKSYRREIEERWESKHSHAIALGRALLAQKNGEPS